MNNTICREQIIRRKEKNRRREVQATPILHLFPIKFFLFFFFFSYKYKRKKKEAGEKKREKEEEIDEGFFKSYNAYSARPHHMALSIPHSLVPRRIRK